MPDALLDAAPGRLRRPRLDLARASATRSPLERTLLPGFAVWFVDKVAELKPDIFVPVETKGARLLEAVIEYARVHLGVDLTHIPILYTPALAYIPPDDLRSRRVVVLDDAKRSGRTLERHMQRIKDYGAEDVQLVACVGYAAPPPDEGPGDSEEFAVPVECYSRVGHDLYREYLSQMAELVVARGLPPEVDHHVFRLKLPGRLPDVWQTLAYMLRPYGALSFDGPVTTNEDIISMTLHFPELPGTPRYPLDGPVRDEGVKKLRLFADLLKDSIHVVPMAFPALDLHGRRNAELDPALCNDVVRGWTGGRSTIADPLVSMACTRDAETLFRAVSTATEVDLIAGFARVVGQMCGESKDLSFVCEPEPFGRLYGEKVGAAIANDINRRLAAVISEGSKQASGSDDTGGVADEDANEATVLRVDSAVVDNTKRIARYLKVVYEARAKQPDFEPTERVGLSLSELEARTPPAGIDLLLLSRCIDFGLAMTTLVPYTDLHETADGRTQVRRRYRVSEANRDEERYEDVDIIRLQLGEETIALIARFLTRHGDERWRGEAIPHSVVSLLAAILEPTVLTEHQIPLTAGPGTDGPTLELGGPAAPQTIFDVVSEYFRLAGDGITPTDVFDRRYTDDTLRLDLRDSATAVEEYLQAIGSLPPEATDPDGVLLCWAMSAAGRLGLDYVEWHLRQALESLDRPLTRTIRGDRLEPQDLQHPVERANRSIESARETVQRLSVEWSAPVRQAWPDPIKAQKRLRQSLAAPSEGEILYRLADALCTAVASLATEVEALLPWIESDDSDEAIAKRAVDAVISLEQHLTTVREPEGAPHLPDDPAERRRFTAEQLKRGGLMLRAFVAAIAWRYRVPARDRRQPSTASRRRTVLFVDLSESTRRAIEARHDVNWRWKTEGLNLVAQWGHAFGGRELKDRAGDDICLEFERADSAMLCAALVQQHAKALRSTDVRSMHWAFRMALDTAELADSAGGNVISAGIDIAAKLSKKLRDPASIERVLVTPATVAELSREFEDRDLLVRMDQEVDLAPDLEFSESLARARFHPYSADSEAIANFLVLRYVAPDQVRSIAQD